MQSKTFSFRAHERRSLLKMLRNAGVADCEKSARRFEDCICCYAPSIEGRMLAITCCSRLLRLCARNRRISWDAYDLLPERRTKGASKKRDGRTLWSTFCEAFAKINSDMASAYLDYYERAWHGTKRCDRQFRRLCVALGELWEEEVGSHFPQLKRTSPRKWASKGLPDHPLILMLEAVYVFLDGSTMEAVVEYANTSMKPWRGELPDCMQECD